jgi:hypothetical protein
MTDAIGNDMGPGYRIARHDDRPASQVAIMRGDLLAQIERSQSRHMQIGENKVIPPGENTRKYLRRVILDHRMMAEVFEYLRE